MSECTIDRNAHARALFPPKVSLKTGSSFTCAQLVNSGSLSNSAYADRNGFTFGCHTHSEGAAVYNGIQIGNKVCLTKTTHLETLDPQAAWFPSCTIYTEPTTV